MDPVPDDDFGGSPGLLFKEAVASITEVGEVGDCCPWFELEPALPWA